MDKGKKTASLISWALYDFANTIFSAVVLTLYFPIYLTSLTGANTSLGVVTTLSMLLAGFSIPVFGALSDRTGKTKRYLLYLTFLCVACMALLSFLQTPLTLMACFLVACFFYHACLVFYNALLPVASAPEKRGFASGLGIGLGYLGVVCVLPVMHQVEKAFGTPSVFWTGAALFLIFSIPLFIFVPERNVEAPVPFTRALMRQEWIKIGNTLKSLGGKPKLLLFLGGNFFLVDALNSTIFWFSVYTKTVFAPPQGTLVLILMALNGSAFASGLLAGFLSDRWGAMKTLLIAAASLCFTLGLLTQNLPLNIFVTLSLTGGAFAIAGIWTTGRKVLLELTPEHRAGEFFGLYGLTTKVSVLASFLYGIASDHLGMRQGLWILFFPALTGMALLVWCSLLKEDNS